MIDQKLGEEEISSKAISGRESEMMMILNNKEV